MYIAEDAFSVNDSIIVIGSSVIIENVAFSVIIKPLSSPALTSEKGISEGITSTLGSWRM